MTIRKTETVDLLRGFKKRASFPVQLIQNGKNLGYAKNFEKSISLCSGEWIALCDQDDIWYPEKLSRLEKALSGSNAIGLVFSNSDLMDEAGNKVGQTFWDRLDFNVTKQSKMRNDPFGLLLHGPCITGMAMMFRSDYCSKILPIPQEWHHDAWIALLVSLLAKIEPISDCLNAYRVHSAQQTYVTLAGRIKRVSLSSRAGRYRQGANRYEQVKARIQSWDEDVISEEISLLLDGKIRFMKDRLKTYSSLFWWPIVMRQWIRGGYRMYGSGTRGAIGDLLLLGNPTKNEN